MEKPFSFIIQSTDLAKGLRPSKKSPRDAKYLIEAIGAIGGDNVLSAVDSLTRTDTSTITDGFPFPQIFVFTNLIIVCDSLHVYELVSGSLSLKYTASGVGSTWSAVDFYDYIYMSNGKVSITRDAGTGVYSVSTLPTALALLNFNGQVIAGSPDSSTIIPAFNLDVKSSVLSSSASITGVYS